jgi:hypothetical protein
MSVLRESHLRMSGTAGKTRRKKGSETRSVLMELDPVIAHTLTVPEGMHNRERLPQKREQPAHPINTVEACAGRAESAMNDIADILEAVGEVMRSGNILYPHPEPIPDESTDVNVFMDNPLPNNVLAKDFTFNSNITCETK